MPSDKQIAANRANAQKSTGPRSINGKAASRLNALKHGIYAKDKTMFGDEAADLEKFAATLHLEYGPRNSTERFLVDTLIHSEWRLRRVRRAEACLWQYAKRKLLRGDAVEPTTRAFYSVDSQFVRLQTVINACERNRHLALTELRRLQADGSQLPESKEVPSPNGFVWHNPQSTRIPPSSQGAA
jgi:hypothetical protein